MALNILHRIRPQQTTEPVPTPDRLKLSQEPKADVSRYYALLKRLSIGMIVSMPLITQTAHGVAHAAR